MSTKHSKIVASKSPEPPTPSPASGLLTEEQAATFLGILPRTCRDWRQKRGLPHLKLTSKIVRYRLADIQAWLDRHSVAMTS
jgi:predicted DNA-binding transcriptional regulator AlpA